MQLESSLILLWIDEEAGNVDEIKADGQEEWLLPLSLKDQCHARLVVIPQIN